MTQPAKSVVVAFGRWIDIEVGYAQSSPDCIEQHAAMTSYLTPSPHLVHAPPFVLGYSHALTPTSHASWAEMFQCHRDALDLLLTPGDYRSWGVLSFADQPGYSEDRPRTLRYYNPEDHARHPLQRRNAANVDSLQFSKAATRNWFVQGLTISAPSADPGTNQDPANITVDLCLIEDFDRYGFRIRNTTNCTVQQCVIRDSRVEADDSSGIQVKGQGDREVLGIRILDNEIYNVGDCIQITDNPDDHWLAIEVLIEGNDLYVEKSRYVGETNTTLAENAIDVKGGSSRPGSTVIRNNRMWGTRRSARLSSTSQGELLVLQRYARNAIIEQNILGDAPRGMKDEVWHNDPLVGAKDERNIELRSNQFYAIRDFATADRGAITKPITSHLRFIENHFARSRFVLDVPPDGGYGVPLPEFTDNIRVEVDEVHRLPEPPQQAGPLLPFDLISNPAVSAPFGFEYYQRRRWTGPALAAGAVPRSSPWHRLFHPGDWPLLGRRGPVDQ